MEKIIYEKTTEFEKDLKKLCKKYRSLVDDLEVLKKSSIELFHIHEMNNNSIFPITGCCTETSISYKVKKFSSKSFKGKGVNTGLRLIYIYQPLLHLVLFVEIYYKGVKENEDKDRLQFYLENLGR